MCVSSALFRSYELTVLAFETVFMAGSVLAIDIERTEHLSC